MPQLPHEIFYIAAIDYLSCYDVLKLASTCRDLRTLLLSSQKLWSALTFRKTGINYIHDGGDWRKACWDSEFCAMCPHLSDMSYPDVLQNRIQRFQSIVEGQPFETIACSTSECGSLTPDLWMCLTKDCYSIGCGRTKNQHAINHFLESGHSICVKLNTLEFWCYKCTKWMGKQTEYVAETHFTDKIISAFLKPNQEPYKFLDTHFASWNKRRYIERGMYKIVESDRLYMLSRDFLLQWREFLLSNAGPPDGIDNWSLIINAEEGDEDGFTGRDESEYRIHPDALPFRDFGLISERDYLNLYSFYGGGPSLSVEQNIPTDDPIYSGLRQRIYDVKSELVKQCEAEAREEQNRRVEAWARVSPQIPMPNQEEEENSVHTHLQDIRVLETLLHREEGDCASDNESEHSREHSSSGPSSSPSRGLFHPAAPLKQ